MIIRFLSILLFVPQYIYTGSLSKIQNGMIGEPEVICDIRQITIRIRTLHEFSGNLYTKGFFHKTDCRIRGDSSKSMLEIVLPVDADCGIRRKRMVSPRGILLDTTIILMFHPVFLTQTDRSYHVQCQYTESDRTVTNTLDVSMQPASELPQSVQQQDSESAPVCKYEVLMGSDSGPPLSHATVGDAVYHKWSCEGENKEMYCMTVHSCVVDDGQGFGQKLVDEQGCTLDSFLLKELEYNEKLEAGQMSNVFKFADKPTVFFSCMIRVEMKESSKFKCFNPAENCNMLKTGSSKSDIMTKQKISNEIPPGFPRPPNDSRLNRSRMSDTLNSDYADFGDEDLILNGKDNEKSNFDSSKIPASTMTRLIRRDVSSKILADIDVSAPSVDVMDIPETDVGKPEKIGPPQETKKDDKNICVSRFSIVLLLLILIVFTFISIMLTYLIMSRIMSKSQKHHKSGLPHPNFGRSVG